MIIKIIENNFSGPPILFSWKSRNPDYYGVSVYSKPVDCEIAQLKVVNYSFFAAKPLHNNESIKTFGKII